MLKNAFVVIRIVLVFALAAAIYSTAGQIQSAVQYHKANTLLESVQRKQSSDYPELLRQFTRLSQDASIQGIFSVHTTRAQSLVYLRTLPEPLISEQALKESFENALKTYPYDSYLWAKLALHQSHLEGVSDQMQLSLDSAIAFGRNDYQTFRILTLIAIQSWPNFNCAYKEQMLGIVKDGLIKNDFILSQWNTNIGHMPIGKYITLIIKNYDFNQRWAEIQTRVCKQNHLEEQS